MVSVRPLSVFAGPRPGLQAQQIIDPRRQAGLEGLVGGDAGQNGPGSVQMVRLAMERIGLGSRSKNILKKKPVPAAVPADAPRDFDDPGFFEQRKQQQPLRARYAFRQGPASRVDVGRFLMGRLRFVPWFR